MSARTLRTVIAIAVVTVIFIYVASLQISDQLPVKSPDQGKPGGPVAGLTKKQLEKFYRCKQVFEKRFTPQEGLGPLYNAESCSACHSNDRCDSTDHGRTVLFAKRASKSKHAAELLPSVRDKLTLSDVDYLENLGGPVMLSRSITDDLPRESGLPADCKCPARKQPPADAEIVSRRSAPQLCGLGLIDNIADETVSLQADIQSSANSAIKGKLALPAVIIAGLPSIGRFGHKAQDATLFTACAKELGIHLGLSNQGFPHTITPNGRDNLPDCLNIAADADQSNKKLLVQLVYYLSLVAPPPTSGQQGENDEAQEGARQFAKLGCAQCHVPELITTDKVFLLDPDSNPIEMEEFHQDERTIYQVRSESKQLEIKALENLPVHAYSDFLLHDMGKELADGFPQGSATGGQWRTAPLWGCKQRTSFLHDGRASSLEAAILMHGGEAAQSAKLFSSLNSELKSSLIKFLQTL